MSSNSVADASELLENLEEIVPRYHMYTRSLTTHWFVTRLLGVNDLLRQILMWLYSYTLTNEL